MSIIGGVLASVAGSVASSLFGKDSGSSSEGVQSAMQGPTAPLPNQPAPVHATGSQAKTLIQDTAKEMLGKAKGAVVDGVGSLISNKFGKSASQQGQDTKDYLAAAFPELTPWERAGAGGSMSGSANEGFQNATKLKQMELSNAKDIAKIQQDTAISTAKIAAAPSHERNAQDAPQTLANIDKLRADTSLSGQQLKNAIAEELKTYATINNIKLTDKQIIQNTALLAEKTTSEAEAKSIIGGMAHDAKTWASKAYQGVGSFIEDRKAAANAWKQGKKNPLTIHVQPKMK